MPDIHAAFPNCGNWRKGRMAFPEIGRLLERLTLACIESSMESFPDITGRSLSFSYDSYKSGDRLLTHDDRTQANVSSLDVSRISRRSLALVSYVQDEREPDWGGELIIYKADRQTGTDRPKLRISHCIAPEPGSLALFTVPRYHRVCRVDPGRVSMNACRSPDGCSPTMRQGIRPCRSPLSVLSGPHKKSPAATKPVR